MTDKKPNPGSDEAIKAGCTCPILDNEYGKGWMGDPNMFVFSHDCPLRGDGTYKSTG